MCRRPPTLLLAVLGLLAALAPARPAVAAAPRLILVHGGGLAQPVLLADWLTNGLVLGVEAPDVSPTALTGRLALDLALFWGPMWMQYVDEGRPLDALRPEQANQHGRFYPASGTAEALIVLESIPGPGAPVRRLSPDGLVILAAHGIPTHTEADGLTPRPPGRLPATGGGGTAWMSDAPSSAVYSAG